jgi:hypothetical protein
MPLIERRKRTFEEWAMIGLMVVLLLGMPALSLYFLFFFGR